MVRVAAAVAAGDLIAGLFLAWTAAGLQPQVAAEKAIGTVQGVLERTVSRLARRRQAFDDGSSKPGTVCEGEDGGMARALELDLVGSKRLIEEGPVFAHATPLSC